MPRDSSSAVQPIFRILVIAGGTSEERTISLDSGQCVAAALRQTGHIVESLDPAEQPLSRIDPLGWDVAFPVLHGTEGEDGVLQRALESVGLPWVGCSAESSALTFDKHQTRRRLQRHGIPVPAGAVIRYPRFPSSLTLPVVVKPARQGSSIGISVVESMDCWDAAAQQALSLGSEAVVESYIAGREVSITVIDDRPFPPVEIIAKGSWYDYAAKYVSDETQYVVNPAGLPADIGTLALRACEVCEAHGILRVDFRVDLDNQPWVLEINSIPGMTSHSLVPKTAAAAGLSLPELCDQCVRRRMDRQSSAG